MFMAILHSWHHGIWQKVWYSSDHTTWNSPITCILSLDTTTAVALPLPLAPKDGAQKTAKTSWNPDHYYCQYWMIEDVKKQKYGVRKEEDGWMIWRAWWPARSPEASAVPSSVFSGSTSWISTPPSTSPIATHRPSGDQQIDVAVNCDASSWLPIGKESCCVVRRIRRLLDRLSLAAREFCTLPIYTIYNSEEVVATLSASFCATWCNNMVLVLSS